MAIYVKQTWEDNNPVYSVSAVRMDHIEDGLFDLSTALGGGVVPASGLGANSVTTVKIADGNVTTAKILDANVTDAKLASPSNGIYRRVAGVSSMSPLDQVAATLLLRESANAQVSGATAAVPIHGFYFDNDDFTVAGKTTKLRLRAQTTTNTQAAPGITFTFGLYPVTFSGITDTLVPTAGTVVSGSTVAIATPLVSSVTSAVTADFDVPADGYYAFGVVTSGTLANTSSVGFSAQLQMRHV